MISSFKGTCLNAKSIYFYGALQNSLRNISSDMGIMVLALLANDRYQALVNPIPYKISLKHPMRRLTAVFAIAVGVTVIDLLGQVLWLQEKLTWTAMLPYGMGYYLIRTTFDLVCLCM